MKSINILFILVLSLFAGNMYANRNIAVPVIKYDFTSFRAGNDMHIDLTADISQLQLHTQHMIVITPVIVSSQGEEIHTFESFIIAGRKRSKALHRDMAFENSDMDPSLKEISTLIPLTGKKKRSLSTILFLFNQNSMEPV
ncbi:MAG: DUF3868 domain-containing protein [Bacteroides sp.]|nr:DUF3868 domain-containing protein [Bacteroides sp.]